jgi:NitT/TauT family transport system ATP-binding protein
MSQRLKLIQSAATAAVRPAVEAVAVTHAFATETGPMVVLENISFAAEAGQMICLLGPSGCGKTTLLNIVAGFMPASHGSVRVDGRTVSKPGADRCVVFQEDALFPWLTVAENIAFGLRGRMRRKAADREIKRFLGLVGLRAYADYMPADISGGMKQRVALARVLILKPRVLLMDEPFGALDAQTREEMQNLLLGIWKELGHTILFVTHDISEAVTLADRILVLGKNPGRILNDIAVPLPRPRKKESDTFHHFYRSLREKC